MEFALRDTERKNELTRFLAIDYRAWRETQELACPLDRHSKKLPLRDSIIALRPMQPDTELVTRDRHFGMIPALPPVDW